MQSLSGARTTYLPDGSSMDHSGLEIPVQTHIESASRQLEAKVARRITEFTQSDKPAAADPVSDNDQPDSMDVEEMSARCTIVEFSALVQKMRSTFIAILRDDPACAHLSLAQQRRIVVQENNALAQNLQKITLEFMGALEAKEKAAKQAFCESTLDTAYSEYSLIAQALAYEKGSDRYFHVQLCLLATLLEQARTLEDIKLQEQQWLLKPAKRLHYTQAAQLALTIEDLTNKGEVKAEETIRLLLELKQDQRSTNTFRKEYGALESAINEFIREQFSKNEKEFQGIQEKILKAGRSIDLILSQVNLQRDKGLEDHLLGQLTPVQEELDACGVEFARCKVRHNTLADFCEKLNLKHPSECDAIQSLYDRWNNLSKSTIKLLTDLRDSETDQGKTVALIDWITTNIESYKANELSALHAWALSYLGKLFFSGKLSQEALKATVDFVRGNAQILFKHFRAFPCDVQLNYRGKHPDMSLLALATISRFIERMYCSVESIAQLRTWSWGDMWNALPVVGDQSHIKKPQIELDDRITTAVPQIRDPETIFDEYISAFQQNNFKPLSEKPIESQVCYFEAARHAFETPEEIVALSIQPLHTTEFQYQLDALLLLRFAMARTMVFPYDQMKTELSKSIPKQGLVLTNAQLLQWISWYKPGMIGVNDAVHHTLFLEVAATAIKLHQGKEKFSDVQLAQIFTFLTDLYTDIVLRHTIDAQVKRPQIDSVTKNILDTQLAQFGARCVGQARDVQVYQDNKALALLEYLDTTELDKIKAQLLGPARTWLERSVYPRLKTLVLKSGLTAEGRLGDLKRCTQITSLVMPLNGENSDTDVKALGTFADLRSLTLHDGKVSTKHLDAIPLTALTLNTIEGSVDLSGCCKLQRSLKELSLFDVELVPGSLAWASQNQNLEVLSVSAKTGTHIGCLARDTQVYGTRQLRALWLSSTNFEEDEELKQSLPRFIDSHPTLTKLSLFVTCRGSLLTYLLTSKKAAYIQSLAINLHRREISHDELSRYAQDHFPNQHDVIFGDEYQIRRLTDAFLVNELNEELSLLANFVGLSEFIFHTDDPVLVQAVREFNFAGCRSLSRCWWVNSRNETSQVHFSRQELAVEEESSE